MATQRKTHSKIKKNHGKTKKSHDRNKCATHAENRAQTEDSGWYRYDDPHCFLGSGYLYKPQNNLRQKFSRALIFAGITFVT